LTALSPAELLTEPLYNPTGGYASYVVPAAFVLIIQQTLLMGTATLTALGFESRPGVRRIAPGATGLFGRGLAHLTIYASAFALFFVVPPRIYGFSTLDRGCGSGAVRSAIRARHQFYGTGCRQLF
jgi:ABC-2 type transport system permease protein